MKQVPGEQVGVDDDIFVFHKQWLVKCQVLATWIDGDRRQFLVTPREDPDKKLQVSTGIDCPVKVPS